MNPPHDPPGSSAGSSVSRDGRLREGAWSRARWGLSWGFRLAALFSVIALITSIGHFTEVTASYGHSPFVLVALYFVCGALGGTVLGLLRPIGKSLVGAVTLGALVGLPVFSVIFLATAASMRFGSRHFLGFLLFTLPLSTLCAAYVWFRQRGKSRG